MANGFMMDAEYMKKMREGLKDSITYAKYQIAGGEWYRADVQSAKILPDGRIEALFLIDQQVEGDVLVTGVELYDKNDTKLGHSETRIERGDATSNILYAVRLDLFQAKKADGDGEYNKV